MTLKLSAAALDWALRHTEKFGDTDIFPDAFEVLAIRSDWTSVRSALEAKDVLGWSVRPWRRCLVPKHRFGFRISTQLDLIDTLIFTALIYEVGEKLEASRVSADEGIVHSYRFSPADDGRMFSDKFTYRTFQSASHKRIDELQPTHVVVADIADFFPRLYIHRIDNALDTALGVGHMHATALKHLVSHWAGAYSYGIPVGSAASRILAELTISDVDQVLLSEGVRYLRYSDDFRIYASSEAEAYKQLTLLARTLFENHGLTLQQNKTKIISVELFRSIYLKENDRRELETLSEKFHQLISDFGLDGAYDDIDFDSLDESAKNAIEQLNLREILEEQIGLDEPDLSLIKFILRRLGQIGDADAAQIVLSNVSKFVPAIREAIEYILRLGGLGAERKLQLGERLLGAYSDANSPASHLEYSRMYLLHPFSIDKTWSSGATYVQLYNDAIDDFSRRELLLAMGRSKKDFWFRSRKQSLNQLSPWLRSAFIYGASCLPVDEYKHWIRGVDAQLDLVEKAVANWSKKNPISA